MSRKFDYNKSSILLVIFASIGILLQLFSWFMLFGTSMASNKYFKDFITMLIFNIAIVVIGVIILVFTLVYSANVNRLTKDERQTHKGKRIAGLILSCITLLLSIGASVLLPGRIEGINFCLKEKWCNPSTVEEHERDTQERYAQDAERKKEAGRAKSAVSKFFGLKSLNINGKSWVGHVKSDSWFYPFRYTEPGENFYEQYLLIGSKDLYIYDENALDFAYQFILEDVSRYFTNDEGWKTIERYEIDIISSIYGEPIVRQATAEYEPITSDNFILIKINSSKVSI